jgi:drug/metabolite transporter (DMT)-like permease
VSPPPRDAATSAKLMVVVIGLVWGFNWVAARIILSVLPPWTMRALGIGLGAATLFTAASIAGVRLRVRRGERLKVVIAGFFNVAIFNACSAYAQVYSTTSRAIVIANSMPIWAALLSRLALKERFNAAKLAGLVLCTAGLVTLIWPLARAGFPLGALFALICAWTWASGTIYLKWAQIDAPVLAVAAWQLLFGWLMLMAGMLWFEGVPNEWPLPPHVLAWIGYNGVIGMGMAYFLWFVVVERLPATTASLGLLLSPVVGVLGSAWLLGERPSLPDIVGFVLIFSAASTVLLQPNVRHTEMPE